MQKEKKMSYPVTLLALLLGRGIHEGREEERRRKEKKREEKRGTSA
jgi:hypothetical protein